MRILVLNGASSATGAVFALLSSHGLAPSPAGDLTIVAKGLVTGQGGAERLPMLLAAQLDMAAWAASRLSGRAKYATTQRPASMAST